MASSPKLGVDILRVSGGDLSTTQFNGILNALPNHIALLDSEGELLLVNEAWLRFASENGMSRRKAATGNYLEVCRRAAEFGDETAHRTVKGIESVLKGKVRSFELDYPCDSLTEKRWFRLSVYPVEVWGDRCCLVSHSDITPRASRGRSVPTRKRLASKKTPQAKSSRVSGSK